MGLCDFDDSGRVVATLYLFLSRFREKTNMRFPITLLHPETNPASLIVSATISTIKETQGTGYLLYFRIVATYRLPLHLVQYF